MRKISFILFLVPLVMFSQSQRDQKKYNNIVELIKQNELELAKQESYKLLKKNKDWKKPHLLLSNIFLKEQNYEKGVEEFFKYYNINSQKSSFPVFQLAEVFYKEGVYLEALKYFNISANLSEEENKYSHYINNCRFAIDAMENPVKFDFKNMGKNINTENAEYLPFISADGNEFIFTRLLEFEEGMFQEDFYKSEKINGDWIESLPMEINTIQNEGSVTVSADGSFLIYTACNREDGKGRCDLYLCVKQENGKWSKSENVSNINSRDWESQACFSPDLRYVYFVSDRRGGYGGDDIWRSEITRFGFSSPENLGLTINTKEDEMSPFFHPDNLTFYFASEGHTGMGDFDLFVSRRLHSDTFWGIPENLGYPINSHNTENSLVVSNDGKTAYFVSDKSGYGKEDIFTFQLPEDKRSTKISELELEIITQNNGNEIILKNVLFETDSYELVETSFIELNTLINYLKKNPKIKIHIEGHTDNISDDKHNLILSDNRAAKVYGYLVDRGVSSERLSYKGYGESKPISTNKTDQGRRQNRRTSFIIIP
ncbi:MAG: OmpA family protein [Flavobacteriales bacterium]|jgi:outer membrane protein OmpA-like peptidoglycan-associated protein/tetratricopeptide (TPR) repeat protein|nr:OmpA family protein [Flavobacteriales bacterium]